MENKKLTKLQREIMKAKIMETAKKDPKFKEHLLNRLEDKKN
jgi:hypothetical protein